MMRKRGFYGIVLGCALALCSVSGCAGEKAVKEETEEGKTDQNQETGHKEIEISLPSDTGFLLALNQLSDGTLKGVGSQGSVLTSKDGGNTWESEALPSMGDEDVKMEMACVSADGGLFLSFGKSDEEAQQGQSNQHEYYYISPKGEVQQVIPKLPGEEGNLILGSFLSDTEVLAWNQGDTAFYQISMESGECEKLFEAGQGYNAFCYTGEDVVADAGNSLMVYNMELGTTTMVRTGSKAGRKLAAGKEKGTFYLLNSQGIYQYKTTEEKGKLAVSGNTNALGDPSLSPRYFLALDHGDFLAVFQKGNEQTYQVMKYSMEAEGNPTSQQGKTEGVVEAVQMPEEKGSAETQELDVYILDDSELMRLAIAAFQKNNPGVKVSLEVGVTGENAVTATDAIKTLNTELASGGGPDVIILDGLPIEDYIEKGVLEDVSSVLEEYGQGQLYEKIVETYEEAGTVYAIPTRFELPFLVSEGDFVKDTGNLEQVADAVEQYGRQEADIRIVGPITPRQMIEAFYDAYMPGFYSQDQELSEENIASFFRQAARIYEVRKGRISEEEQSRGEALDQESLGDEFSGPVSGIGQWLAGGLRLSINHIGGVEHYGMLTSLAKTNEDISIQGIGNVYDPMRIAGVSAKSDAKEEGKNFLKLLLSKEIQENSSDFEGAGFPVNKEALENFQRTGQQKNGDYLREAYFPTEFVLEKEDADSFQHEKLEIYWPTDEDYQNLEEIFEKLQVPYRENEELKQAVVEQGSRCLNGESTPDVAAKAVMQEIRIQLLE